MAAKVGEEVYTGSHLASAEAVADGRADLAAIDCVTWSLLKAARSNLTSRLRVIGTAPTLLPGLPYVVSADATEEEIEAIREAIRRCLTGNATTLGTLSPITQLYRRETKGRPTCAAHWRLPIRRRRLDDLPDGHKGPFEPSCCPTQSFFNGTG